MTLNISGHKIDLVVNLFSLARSATLIILLPSSTKFLSELPPIIWVVVSPCLPASESVTVTAATRVPGFASSFTPADLRPRKWLRCKLY